jgi:hypothetical protein
VASVKLEDQRRFEVAALVTHGPDLSIRCTRCHRWAAHIDRPLGLDEVIGRADEHAEVCR